MAGTHWQPRLMLALTRFLAAWCLDSAAASDSPAGRLEALEHASLEWGEEDLPPEWSDGLGDECVLLQIGLDVGRRSGEVDSLQGLHADTILTQKSAGQHHVREVERLRDLYAHAFQAGTPQRQSALTQEGAIAMQHSSLLGAALGLEGASNGELALTLETGLLSAALVVACVLLFLAFATGEPQVPEARKGDDPSAGGRARLSVLDNAKFLLMVLIVIDHSKGNAEHYWGWTTGVPELEAITQCHTRIYCFLSGVVARDPPTQRAFRNLVTRLVLPIILFSFVDPILVLSQNFWPQVKCNLFLARSAYLGPASLVPIWYLHSLVLWKLGGYAIYSLPPYAKFLVAFAISAVGGYILPLTCSAVEPAAVFFVVFVCGQLCPIEDLFKRLPLSFASVTVGLTLLAASTVWLCTPAGLAYMDDASVPIWGWSPVPHENDLASGLYWLRGLFRHTFELSRGFVFLFLVCPRSPGLLSDWGQRSLYAYLLNNPLLTNICKLCYLPASHTRFGQACQVETVITFSCVFAALLSTSWVRMLFQPILEPAWLERLLLGGPKAGASAAPDPEVAAKVKGKIVG